MKKLSYLLISVMAIMSFSGCSLLGSTEPPTGDASELVKEAFNKLYDVKTYKYEASFSGTINAAGEAVDMDFGFSGVQDNSDATKPKFSLALDGSGSFAEFKDQAVKAEVRLDGENLYVVLNELSDFNGQVPAELVSSFMNTWYKIPVPADAFEQYAMISVADDENLTPEEKEVKELLENTVFFKDIKFVENKGGRFVYEGVLDKEAFIDFALKVAEIGGEAVSDSEKADLEKMVGSFDLVGQIGIDEKSGVLTMLNGTFTFNVEEGGEKVEANMSFESSISDVDKPVTIEVPADSTDFDPMMLLGPAMMMGGGAGMYDTTDPAMFDDVSGMEDFGTFEMEGDLSDYGVVGTEGDGLLR